MANIYRKIYKEIKKYPTIVIARHIGADPDALGSEFALKELILNKFPNKDVYAIGNPSNRFKFMGALDKPENIDYTNALLIVLDTPDIKRIDGAKISDYKNIIKIDHHPVVDSYANIELVDDTASSTSQLILEFIFKNRLKLTSSIAKNLYTGIVSDTGRFMHSYTSHRTFELVTKMLKKTNLDFTNIYEPLYMRPLPEFRFQGYIYENMEVTPSGLAYIKISEDLLKEYGVDSASSGNIISELKCIDEIIVWIFLTEDKKSNLIRANIRSRGPIINEVAAIYGGGGHKFASGARLTSWSQADNLIEDLEKITEQYQKNKASVS
ncbi:MAG: bifunctional oligoribonuclease/PAP phosphatase NrnA [Bacilli bacterium]|nr:bifunctional oligoribonuclease/PAP phosphatase NrnA [Bacilli bacterium]